MWVHVSTTFNWDKSSSDVMDPVSLPPLRHLLSFPSFAIYESLEDHKVKVLDFFHSYCGQPLEKKYNPHIFTCAYVDFFKSYPCLGNY